MKGDVLVYLATVALFIPDNGKQIATQDYASVIFWVSIARDSTAPKDQILKSNSKEEPVSIAKEYCHFDEVDDQKRSTASASDDKFPSNKNYQLFFCPISTP